MTEEHKAEDSPPIDIEHLSEGEVKEGEWDSVHRDIALLIRVHENRSRVQFHITMMGAFAAITAAFLALSLSALLPAIYEDNPDGIIILGKATLYTTGLLITLNGVFLIKVNRTIKRLNRESKVFNEIIKKNEQKITQT